MEFRFSFVAGTKRGFGIHREQWENQFGKGFTFDVDLFLFSFEFAFSRDFKRTPTGV